MANKAGIAVLGLGLGAVAAVALVTRARAAPDLPSVNIPTTDEVMASRTIGELDVYYSYIGQLLVTGQIDEATYTNLYNAYAARFYELTGWQQ